ncbi:hypothetical protein [Palleronia sp.]|uniref:hypothetical protein n=1 Tax=Palleronia sp. TaxID=1940284 RepID=UPI0035C87A7F
MAKKRISVTKESRSGLNIGFNVPGRGHMPRHKLVPEVERGAHPGYHVRTTAEGMKFVASNPKGSKSDNLG